MRKWIVYYGDGTRFTWEDGTPFDAPRTNVQLIVVEDDKEDQDGWLFQSDAEYYYYDSHLDIWYVADTFAMYDILIRCRTPLVLFGRYIDRDQFNAILRKAVDDVSAMGSKKTRWRRGKPSWLEGSD